jgi:hypothetical protein
MSRELRFSSKNLPANVPVRPTKEISLQRKVASDASRLNTISQALPSIPEMVLTRSHLAHFVRFASRVTARSAMPGLRCCLFGTDSAVVTALDVSLRTILPGARDIGVLVPVDVLKRSINFSDQPETHIVRELTNPSRPFGVRVDQALISGHDPAEFPAASALFPDGWP